MCPKGIWVHRVLGVLHRVPRVLHKVLGILHRVLGVPPRVLGVLHTALGVLHRVLGVLPRFPCCSYPRAQVDEVKGYQTKAMLSMPVSYEGQIMAVAQLANKGDRAAFTQATPPPPPPDDTG